MSYQVMRVRGLHCITRDFVIRWLCSCRFQSGHDVSAVYQYLLPATPLLEDLAVSCRYYRDPHLTQLFLPILILKGRIHITSANIKQVLDYWKSTRHGVLVSFTHLKVEDAEGMQYFSFLPFLGHLTNLQVLVVGSLVGDDLLAVLGINCCHLMIFDAREDTGSLISDVGLAYLAQCKKLRCVYFSVFANEYDCAIEQLGFSGKGVALLLLLPEIEHVQCSEYLLRDAIHFLYQTNYHKKTIAIQCMLLDHQEVNVSTLQMLPFFCPKLEVLALRSEAGNDKIVGKAIKALPHLKMLIMTVGSVCRFKDLTISSYGPQLTYLYLTTYLLDSQDLIMLSQACSQLKTFILKMHSFGFDVSSTSNVGSLFPTVEKLELLQNISVRLFKVLNMKMQNLKEVHCTWALVCNLDEALKAVVEGGGWRHTELLVLPESSEISLDTAQMVASSLPNLKCLAVNVHQNQESELWRFLGQNLPGVRLINHFPIQSPSTKGVFAQDIWTASWVSSIGKKS